jgi:hypothetical protein
MLNSSVSCTISLSAMPQNSEKRKRQLILAAAYVSNVIVVAIKLYALPLYWKQEYHTSKLSGEE